MDKLSESLIILEHFNDIIKSRNEFCKRFKNFDTFNCVGEIMNHFLINGYVKNVKILQEEPYLSLISTQCSDIRINIHNNFCFNIIDMFSFNEEYNNFFSENLTKNVSLKNRISRIKTLNKSVINKVNWEQLKKFRNTILAHNLRDKKNSNSLAINNLIELNELVFDFSKCIEYCEIIDTVFLEIKKEFKEEYIIAKTELNILINEKKNC